MRRNKNVKRKEDILNVNKDSTDLLNGPMDGIKSKIGKEKDNNSQENTICVFKQYYQTPCFFFMVSLFLCSLCSFMILIGTELYDTAIIKILTLKENGTVFGIWEEPDCETIISIYPFNYSNIENIKTERPHVEELGPYVFKEKTKKVNIVFNENGTVTFSENRTHVFDPTASNGNIDDVLYTPNVPFMSAAAQGAEKGMFSQLALAAFLKGLDTRLFLPVNVLEFVDGFDDSFSVVARKISTVTKGVTPPKFGMLTDRNGLSTDRLTIGTGIPDLDKFGLVYGYNGAYLLDFWKTEECNTITGSDGTFFPPHNVQKKSTVYIFLPRFCRRVPLTYNGINQVVNDFPSKRFEMPHNIFSSPEENPNNACFCEGKECPPSGTFSTSKCSFGAPLTVSYPHFLHGDPELRTNVTGLNPDLEKHKFYLDLHTMFGITMGGRMRFQLNIVVHHCPFLLQLKAIPERTVLPIAWIDVSVGQVKGFGKDVIYHATYTSYYLKQGFLWTSLLIMLLTFVRLCVYLIKNQ